MVFGGKTTHDEFHCANCGKRTRYGMILCKSCSRKLQRSGQHFQMSSGVNRMERTT